MGKNIKNTVGLLLFSALFIGLTSIIYQKEYTALMADVESTFSNAIKLDLDKRLSNSGIPYHFVSIPSASETHNQMITQTEDSVSYISKDSLYMQKDLWQRQSLLLQTILLTEGFPIHPQTLDSIFTNELKKSSYNIPTRVQYINNQTGIIEESEANPFVYKKLYTQQYTLGISKEISVQAFYTLNFSSIYHRAPVAFILLFICWLITITAFIYLSRRGQKSKKILYVPVSDIKKPLESDPLIKISDNIYFDPVKSMILYQNVTVELPKQSATLFSSFLEAPDYYMTNKNIDGISWEKHIDTRNVRSQAIKRLRKELAPIPELKIENINKTGYQLQISSGLRTNEQDTTMN